MDATPKPGQLQGLDAIRFFSMTWVILGHVWGMAASFANPGEFRHHRYYVWYITVAVVWRAQINCLLIDFEK